MTGIVIWWRKRRNRPAQAAVTEGQAATVALEQVEVAARRLEQGFQANTQESATKTPLSIRETPQSISVITRDSVEARQVIGLGQALETAAGVSTIAGATTRRPGLPPTPRAASTPGRWTERR